MMDLATRVTVPESVLFRDLDGEAVLLETATGRYYGLNEVGTRMWSLLQLHGEIGGAYQDLLAEYQIPAHELRRDLLDFIGLLSSRRLLEISSPEEASR
jgi:Coenzyme PQQ synthesis protein D (PqqD)